MSNKVRVAIAGVGNCASSLIQGVYYYRDANPDDAVPGLMHVKLGDYHVSDIEFTAAFDVDVDKVGKDLAGDFSGQNNTYRFAESPHMGVTVQKGPELDGIGLYLSEIIEEAPGPVASVADILREPQTDALVNYMPVGSEEATHFYAEQTMAAGCAFVNAIPVFIASDPAWQQRFREAVVPIIGDDIKIQVGATITHRVLTRLFEDRGVSIDRTYQLNFGGNTDFMNMLERSRLQSKKISKTTAVTSQISGRELPAEDIHVGPSDYIPWLHDRKWCHIRIEGTTFGDVPLDMELKLEVWDSPNSAGVIVDSVRCAKIAPDRGLSGALVAPSAYLKKSPPVQFTDDVARRMIEEFIAGENNETLPVSVPVREKAMA